MTVCKSSVHDATLKTEIILFQLHDVYTLFKYGKKISYKIEILK